MSVLTWPRLDLIYPDLPLPDWLLLASDPSWAIHPCLPGLEFPTFCVFFSVSEKPSTGSMYNVFFKLQSLVGNFVGYASRLLKEAALEICWGACAFWPMELSGNRPRYGNDIRSDLRVFLSGIQRLSVSILVAAVNGCSHPQPRAILLPPDSLPRWLPIALPCWHLRVLQCGFPLSFLLAFLQSSGMLSALFGGWGWVCLCFSGFFFLLL